MICVPCGTAGQLVNDLGRGMDFTKDQRALLDEVLQEHDVLSVNYGGNGCNGVMDWFELVRAEKAATAREYVITILHGKCSGGDAGCGCAHGSPIEMDPNPNGFQGYIDALPPDDPRRQEYERRQQRRLSTDKDPR
jgi:hypothetical protein